MRRDLGAVRDERVDAHARPERRAEALDPARRGREAVGGVLGVDPDLDRVAGARRTSGERQRLAGGDAHLHAHEVELRDELRDGMLDLQARVQLDERERPVRPDEELERAGVPVADVPARALGGGLHLLAQRVVERRRRRLLDELLVAPLDRALALAAREHAAVVIADHLDLDVARGRDRLLDVERAVAERRVRLARRALVRDVQLGGIGDEAHAAPAAAGGRLEQDGVPEAVRRRARLGEARGAVGAGNERHARGAHLQLRERLVAHALHHVRRRPDEDEVVRLAHADELRVLGEEAVAGMDRLARRSSGRRR